MTFRLVTKLTKEDPEVQIASLKYCMGIEAEDIMKTFNLTVSEIKDFEVVLKKFDEYFKPRINVIRMRRLFQRRMQQIDENEETYFRALYTAAEDCEFGGLKKERIRDQFIAGIRDEALAEKLEHMYMSKKENFTLDCVIDFTRTYCEIRTGRQQEKEQMKSENINEISHRLDLRKELKHSRNVECTYCGTVHAKKSCPAFGKTCTSCGWKNHYSRVCRS